MSKNRTTSVGIGILADPGLPTELVEDLAQRLPEYLERSISRDVLWEIYCQTRSLRVDEQGNIPLNDVADQVLPQQGWDVLLCVTDLPRRIGVLPVLADVNTTRCAALASVPALGGIRLHARLRETLVNLVGELGRAGRLPVEVNRERPWLGSFLTPVRWVDQPDPELEASLTLTGLGGQTRLLVGMVRNNRPWRLVPELSKTLTAGFATAAFGIFYSSIWNLADALSPLRLTLISVLAVGSMVTWMILDNGMWERRQPPETRGQAVLYNIATVVTTVVGIVCLYGVLFTVTSLGALAVIDTDYLEQRMGHPVNFSSYLVLAWLASSLGTFAGALGSSLENREAVYRATYGKRERERRRRRAVEQAKNEQSGE